jgi:hypothetical protein
MRAIDQECVDYARECVRLAGLAQDQYMRDQLLNLAREWMAAAMHETPPDNFDAIARLLD